MISRDHLVRTIQTEFGTLSRAPNYFLSSFRRKRVESALSRVWYVCEGHDWTIDLEGRYIQDRCSRLGLNISRTQSARFATESIVHFGSLWTFLGKHRLVNRKRNRLIATVFHGNKQIDPDFRRALEQFEKYQDRLDKIIVSNSVMMARMRDWGIESKRLTLLPIGIDLDLFMPAEPIKKKVARSRWQIPEGSICIGSFQKDGEGWSGGAKPKFIKGPDILVKVCEKLAKRFSIIVLLSGPSRDYVKTELSKRNIPFRHVFLEDYREVVSLYHCIDLYLVTAREEGGPKAIMESMATETPFVTTRVGMAIDLVKHETNGLLVDADDIEGIVSNATRVLEDQSLKERLVGAGRNSIAECGWDKLGEKYTKLYHELGQEEHET